MNRNEEMLYQQNKNLVYAWLEAMQGTGSKTNIAPEMFGLDADLRSSKALWLTRFVLSNVMGLTEEEALARDGILDTVRLGRFLNRPFIRVPLLNDEFIELSSNCASRVRSSYEKYIIRYAYSEGNPIKMLAFYNDLCKDANVRNVRGRKKILEKSIKKVEKVMKQ